MKTVIPVGAQKEGYIKNITGASLFLLVFNAIWASK